MLLEATTLWLLASATSGVVSMANAAVRLSADWGTGFEPDGRLVPPHLDEGAQVEKAGIRAAAARNAVPPPGPRGLAETELPYKLFIDETRYYLQPMLFMERKRKDEVCTPAPYDRAPTYQCVEGQRYTRGCHVFVFDGSFREVGFHTIRIDEPRPYFCNAVLSAGMGDKVRNELLLTVQYFPVDGPVAGKVGDIGSGWRRMTVRLRLAARNGAVTIEQDDGCLGNPNRIGTVPDARERLRQCAAGPDGR
ncbi:MAG: hypothetical protein HZB72_03750 [Burkholderiales bacterium]|nr:hypothetical protein [Burkholderiales bacterium]